MSAQVKDNMTKINELLQLKNISVMDDYFWDMFMKDGTNEVLFKTNKIKEDDSIETQLEITNNIIEKLKAI